MKNLYHAIKYQWVDYRLQQEVKRRYYTDTTFSHIDRSLLTAYIFKNPYTISKNYLKKRQAREVHTYGETPLMTYDRLAKEVDLRSTDTFLELGSGRGRGALFLHHFYKCQVIGIERIPQFVKLSKYIVDKYHQEKVQFICADMLKADLPSATVIYLYGTALSDTEIAPLIAKLKKYPKGVKIISVSYPLTDYDETSFEILKTFSISYPWGETEAYLQTVKI
jgi:protein-L-isoaspartate O-methyltransferase